MIGNFYLCGFWIRLLTDTVCICYYFVTIACTPIFAWNLIFQLRPSHSKYCIPSMLSITVPPFIRNKNNQYGTGSILHGPTRLFMREGVGEILVGASGEGHVA